MTGSFVQSPNTTLKSDLLPEVSPKVGFSYALRWACVERNSGEPCGTWFWTTGNPPSQRPGDRRRVAGGRSSTSPWCGKKGMPAAAHKALVPSCDLGLVFVGIGLP